jgi:tetratricopeptide (TPR) repeat protein
MSNLTAYNFYLKASDYYPYNMEMVMENLNYALSYDENLCQANCLMGRVYMEILKDYIQAEYFFELALCASLEYPDTYKYYSLLMIWKGEYNKALKIIQFGLKVKGMNRAVLYQNKSILYELKGDFKKARDFMEVALKYCFNTCSSEIIEREVRRLNKKIRIEVRRER